MRLNASWISGPERRPFAGDRRATDRLATDRLTGGRASVARRISVLILIAATMALATAAPASAGKCPDANRSPNELTVDRARAAVSCLINRYRKKAGVPAVRYHARLTRAARKHSVSMDRKEFFSHYGPDSSTPLSRIRASGYLVGAKPWGVGENIAYGQAWLGTPGRAVRGWMNSPPHRRTMLNRRYRHVGIGVALGSPVGNASNAAIYTLDFGYRK